jgi:Protein of unknown function (DUF2950)
MIKLDPTNDTIMPRAAAFCLGLLLLSGCAMTTQTTTTRGPEQVFDTPDDAVNALVKATRADNQPNLLKILGPDAAKLIHSGDTVADHTARQHFLAAYDASHQIENADDDTRTLIVGDEGWPMPIPLVRQDNGWRFDTAAGQEEILNRRIGKNELNVLSVCRAYVTAQRDYAEQHLVSGKHVTEYAQRFTSTSGKHNGLYWPVKPGEEESPLGPLIADARAEGYGKGAIHGKHSHTPYHGYYYKILTRQGADAPSGKKDYIVKGHMTRGFALLAFPATYGDSGVMTFIVNQNGIVFEKDLGPDTKHLAPRIDSFNPDKSWHTAKQ